jgi:hypothetical protein
MWRFTLLKTNKTRKNDSGLVPQTAEKYLTLVLRYIYTMVDYIHHPKTNFLRISPSPDQLFVVE